VLYVISDLKVGTPMEEIIKKDSNRSSGYVTTSRTTSAVTKSTTTYPQKTTGNSSNLTIPKEHTLQEVADHVIIKATIIGSQKPTTITVDFSNPKQKNIIGKKVGETFKLEGIPLTYKIEKIIATKGSAQDNIVASTTTSNKTVAPKAVEGGKKLTLKQYFESKGLFTIDCRGWDGCLWVLGDQKKLEPYVKEAMRLYGATGAYGSGKQSNYQPAWWTKSNK
jgi:hypothetical protein